ncbi:hypothetical protein JZU46_04675 [bacterium]|nr:hypothetical protein [bacterium]
MQKFIIETSKDTFLRLMDVDLKNGFHVIPGSNYIKSLPANINVASGQVLDDIEHVFSIAVRDTLDSVVFSENLSLFRTTVNKELVTNHVVVGSLYVEAILKDSYEKCRRVFTTYYSCCLHKDGY